MCKKVSRQREWQKKMHAAGRCMTCGALLPCKPCAVKRGKRVRRKTGHKPWKPGSRGRIPLWYQLKP